MGQRIFLEEQFNLFGNFSVSLVKDKLVISRPVNFNVDTDKIFNDWLFKRADDYIPKRVELLSKRNNFEYNRVKIKNQRSRWGSCSSNNNLSFNYRLICFNKQVIDYVIIHELCHLKEMNHSQKFWDLVEGYIPNYKDYRKMIRNLNN